MTWVRAGVILSLAVLGCTAAVQAQVPEITIDDRRIEEGDSGLLDISFPVTLSQPSAQPVTINWMTPGTGSATPDVDYQSVASGTLTFLPFQTNGVVTVRVVGDTLPESTAQTFAVDLTSVATGNATFRKRRAIGTILDDDVVSPPVTYFAAVGEGGSSAAAVVVNRLVWRVPLAEPPPTRFLIRWNEGDGCTPPNSAVGAHPAAQEMLLTALAPDLNQVYPHVNVQPGRLYCYSLWPGYPAYGPSTSVTIRPPLDPQGRVKWVYATTEGGNALEAPTVGPDAVYTVDANGLVHALGRGPDPAAGAGLWPSGWNPVSVGKRAHFRSPVVGLAQGPRLFVGTEDGEVNSVNAQNGSLVWSALLTPTPVAGGAQAPLAGIFKVFGGQHDLLLAGTASTSANVFRALDPATGAEVDFFAAPPGLGAITGMAVVDYAAQPNRVYFTSRQGGVPETLWALELGPSGTDDLTELWRASTGASDSAPVLRGGRVYHGDNAGRVYSVRASDGGDIRPFNTGDGVVKGFLFPDRSTSALYASTTGRVWKLLDGASSLAEDWRTTVPSPSIPLLWPGQPYLYVGGGDGRLYQIDTPSGNADNSVSLPTAATTPLGAPSLDITHDLLLVPSGNCVFAIRVPY
jgi:outer membrane protein assembly factor BamB